MTDTLYRLRGLEWVKMHGVWMASTPIGRYFIWENHGVFRWQFSDEDERFEDSLSAAQSAAEAHYRERMAEGLVPVEALGTPELTVDGCLICSNTEELWLIHNGEVRRVDRTQDGSWMCFTDGDDEDPPCPWPLHERCYSTRAAAGAAKKEP